MMAPVPWCMGIDTQVSPAFPSSINSHSRPWLLALPTHAAALLWAVRSANPKGLSPNEAGVIGWPSPLLTRRKPVSRDWAFVPSVATIDGFIYFQPIYLFIFAAQRPSDVDRRAYFFAAPPPLR